MYENLFKIGKIGSLEIKNRIVMEPMGNFYANEDGTVSEKDIAFYGERAKGGVGLIITEVVSVNGENGRANSHNLFLSKDMHIPGYKKLVEEIHKYDSKIFVEIYHPGRQGISAVNGNKPMLAPSAIECKCAHQPVRAMTTEEAEELVQDFINAAVRAKKAGIDGVELHAAHGYLINQFLSPYTNKRSDKYGGSFENRIRFLEEIILGIREKCGKEYPLIVRLSVDEFLRFANIEEKGIELKDGVEIVKYLEKLGIDAIDVSAGIYETMNTAWEPSSFEQGWKKNLAASVKEEVNIPVFSTAVIRDPAYADNMIAEGICDFVGSARQHVADPEWANKTRQGNTDKIRKCISCLTCMESLMSADITGVPMHCAVNVQAGEELKYSDFKEDGDGRTVVIIGAGPSGLEAARVLALRKFRPVLFEQKSQIGGQLEYANKPPEKDKITWLIDYYKDQCNELAIEIRLNKKPTIDEIKELNPYAVFIAEGSNPIMPKSIKGIDGKNVFSTTEILTGSVKIYNKKVSVVGSGMTGLETAHLLASMGNEITIFEMAEDIGPGLFFQNLIDIQEKLMKFNTKQYTNHKLSRIFENTAEFEVINEGSIKKYDFDYIVISLGTQSNTYLKDELSTNFEIVELLGDSKKPGRIRKAVETGFLAAYNL
ncbi:FAD-dependent oxidoreductase [Clostridium kluyveri]|uniref:Predicted enoate reductase n=2 Tax=Clostridium kluyveri TaxID=1534 RepID=A5N2U3_CLOK5|nr:FAD-dependent oxidoreductase [Clostridium kluyveri]EDK35439.1 Predicted enoate reductase [Clostridium kluyveri DSM 555]BAH08093.1 hypothetical protein CKR_3042 [Clostridium kluyveri NBRC 12016]